MIVESDDLERKKFQMYAEKADTEEKRIKLCRKYLEHKGIRIEVERPPFEPAVQIYADSKHIHRLQTRMMIPMYDYKENPSTEIHIKQQAIQYLNSELLKNDFIKFDLSRDFLTDSMIIRSSLFVWKDPNGK